MAVPVSAVTDGAVAGGADGTDCAVADGADSAVRQGARANPPSGSFSDLLANWGAMVTNSAIQLPGVPRRHQINQMVSHMACGAEHMVSEWQQV